MPAIQTDTHKEVASKQVLLRLTPHDLAAIDRVRGQTPRATWIKQLALAGVAARDAFDGPCLIYVEGRAQ